jgi:hypothetical protein
MEGGRRMSIQETMVYPFSEGWKSIKARFGRIGQSHSDEGMAVPAE